MDNYEAAKRIIEEVLVEVVGEKTFGWQAGRIAAALDEVHLIAEDAKKVPAYTGVLWGGSSHGYCVYIDGRRVSEGDDRRDGAEHRLAMKLHWAAQE